MVSRLVHSTRRLTLTCPQETRVAVGQEDVARRIPNNKKTILRRLHFACAAWKRKKHLFGKTFLTTLFNPKQRPNPGFEPGYHPESWWISSYRLPPPAAPSTDVCHSRQFFNDDPFIRWMCDFSTIMYINCHLINFLRSENVRMVCIFNKI